VPNTIRHSTRRGKYRYWDRQSAELAAAEFQAMVFHRERALLNKPELVESAIDHSDHGEYRYQLASYGPARADSGTVLVTVEGPAGDSSFATVLFCGSELDTHGNLLSEDSDGRRNWIARFWPLPAQEALCRLQRRIRDAQDAAWGKGE
jgi:hypothetical protein